jgi:hypothetical protein
MEIFVVGMLSFIAGMSLAVLLGTMVKDRPW